VIVRADIFLKAKEQGIDISDVCNKALADLMGVDYHQQHLDKVPVPRPVITAQNVPPSEEPEHIRFAHPAGQHPVINADDPSAIAKVMTAKRQPKMRPALKIAEQVSAPDQKKEIVAQSPAAVAASAGRVNKPARGKVHTKKDNGLKKFVTEKITRVDDEDVVICKDDMYQAFTRWCREHKITQVPDRKAVTVALKNKFALGEKTVSGIPCWVNVRLK
jgi:hypothetical protein